MKIESVMWYLKTLGRFLKDSRMAVECTLAECRGAVNSKYFAVDAATVIAILSRVSLKTKRLGRVHG